MTPYYADDWLTLYGGDCREVLAALPPDSVDCVVTSPPYWGLRDYGSDGQLGLERTPEEYVANMVAVFAQVRRVLKPTGVCFLNLGDSYASALGGDSAHTAPPDSLVDDRASDGLCGACEDALLLHNARIDAQPVRGQEPLWHDPSLAHTAEQTALPASSDSGYQADQLADATPHPHGTPTLADEPPPASQESKLPQSSRPPLEGCRHCANCGACLSVLGSSSRDAQVCARRSGRNLGSTTNPGLSGDHSDIGRGPSAYPDSTTPYRLKPKDLVGIPWRVAFALQADGWYLRSDIIWSKPNPMPESVTDRPTKAHEYLFLLTKSARYYFDADAVREMLQSEPHAPGNKAADNWREIRGASVSKGMSGHLAEPDRTWGSTAGRNIRSVWTIATRPYPGAHFAVFPPELPERCIKAGSSERGVCPECGAPWERVVEHRPYPAALANATKAHGGIGNNLGGQRHQDWIDANPKQTTGWRPTCDHTRWTVHATPTPEPVRAVILDPFAGSGTVGMVANCLSRRAILIDLNPEYLKQQMKRNAQTPLGLFA